MVTWSIMVKHLRLSYPLPNRFYAYVLEGISDMGVSEFHITYLFGINVNMISAISSPVTAYICEIVFQYCRDGH